MMAGEDHSYKGGGRKRSMSRKATKKRVGFHGNHATENASGGMHNETVKAKNSSKYQKNSVPHTNFVRKQVDPETAKYFSEIANVIEVSEIDLEERSAICGNALEETRGKEVEVATDYIISHTLQTLLEGCSVDQLCSFLRSCAQDFPQIAMDRSGSHVAETALSSLAVHPLDDETHALVEGTLTTICQAIVVNPVDMMCSCYGSHVFRSLLCLCKGVPLDSSEFHETKPSIILAERLNFRPCWQDRKDTEHFQHGYPNLLTFLVSEMLNAAKKDLAALLVDQYSSLVLQTALKLLIGHEQELLDVIPILLGCSMENAVEGNFIESTAVSNLLDLMKETSYSRLMEVILEVVPESLYNELFTKVFRYSLFKLSSHPCGNFVVQALISHARCQDHMKLIWEEIGTKFMDLLGMGRSGVVASVIAASQRLHSHGHKCCQALATAVRLAAESTACIVPRILFLENYFGCEEKSKWSWPNGRKMHVVGTLILQSVFRCPSEFIQDYITSITSLEADHVLEASKDSGGARVIEAFLSSNVSAKQKRKLVFKFRGHFGELSVHPSGSFTVEKCFNASNMSLRETIVSELLAVQTELSKTKQGPYLWRKLDVDGFAKRPDQWKSRQASKESSYKEFYDSFGPTDAKSSKDDSFLVDAHRTSNPGKLREMRKEIDTSLDSAGAASSGYQFLAHKGSTKLRTSGLKRHPERAAGQHSEKFAKHAMGDDISKGKRRDEQKKKKDDAAGTKEAKSKTT